MSNNSLPCSKCRGMHHPADECVNTPEMSEQKLKDEMRSAMETWGWANTIDKDKAIELLIPVILADRARIVEPLVEISEELRSINLRLPLTRQCQEAIDESLRRAGRSV